MRCHRRRMVLALATSLIVGTACSSGGDSAEPAAPTVVSTEAPTTTEPTAEGPRIVLDDPGAEPRRVLLLRVTAGDELRLTMESRIGIELTINGREAPATEAPNSSTILDQRVERVDPDGTVHFTVSVADVAVDGADPDMVRETQAALSQMIGLLGTGSVDAHGAAQSMDFDTSAIADPQIKATLDSVSSQISNLSAPFPREPVGVGARWTVTSSATISGITMNTTTRYTLRRLSGDHYELEYTQDGDAPPGPVTLPGTPASARASIRSFIMESTGETIGDLTRHVPATNRFDGTGDATMTMTVGGDRLTLDQHLVIGYRLSAA
ncbi:MAG TPA: hypothetical protein VF244_04010 [Acidimicrobiales bacterium]